MCCRLMLIASFVLMGLAQKYTPAITAQGTTYTDPFAYCAAVGTIDAPDARQCLLLLCTEHCNGSPGVTLPMRSLVGEIADLDISDIISLTNKFPCCKLRVISFA